MPSALETLVKILKLEREQGGENRAVIGGLTKFSDNWRKQAFEQARRPEHRILAEELYEIMNGYDDIESRTDRLKQVNYMLDRITQRVPMPQKYRDRLEDLRRDENNSSSRRRGKPARIERRERRKRLLDGGEPHSMREVHEQLELWEQEDMRRISRMSNDEYAGDIENPIAYEEYFVEARPADLDVRAYPKLARPPRRPRPQMDYDSALKALNELNKPVTVIKGVGPTLASKLAKLDIYTIEDMLYYMPRRYDDYLSFPYISRVQPNTLARVMGTIQYTEVRMGRGNRKDFFMVVGDSSGTLNVTFFGLHFMGRYLKKGMQVILNGKTSVYRNKIQMSNPEWEQVDNEDLNTPRIVPVYGLTEGIKARAMRDLMEKVVEKWGEYIPDSMPETVLDRAELADWHWAIKQLHFPDGFDHLGHARRRITFDYLLTLQLAILANRREWQAVPGIALDVSDDFLEAFVTTVFPYELTGAQNRAIADIRRDVAQSIPMNRLIQGDVGSGKTAVATVAMAMAFANGKQAALMAPTSILAEQHYRSIGETLAKMPLNPAWRDEKPVVALLTSALTTTERQSIYRGLADGSIDIVIGTHAIIQEGVEFKELAVAIIDEQHRFGVQQRGALRGKGTNPHLLVMTATPIPRTLALTQFADLDLSIIDEKPPGRQPVQTRVWQSTHRERAFDFIENQLEQGRQAFMVHPLVEAIETIDARSAEEAYVELQEVFYKYRVCLLHGRMSASEKDEIMSAFAHHEYDVMVTTSVAEVGVDVPNASVIVIEGANRFGLSQLHQFRGRVGRGQHKSFCILIPDNDTPESQERLQAMEKTNDGFELAEIDWKLRGAGDLMGTRQSGAMMTRLGRQFKKLGDYIMPELVVLAQQEARTIYEEDPYLEREEHRLLAERVEMMQDDDSDLS